MLLIQPDSGQGKDFFEWWVLSDLPSALANSVPRSAMGEREIRTDSVDVRNHRTLLPESHFPCRHPFLPAERWYRGRSRQGTLQQQNLAVRREADSGSCCGAP